MPTKVVNIYKENPDVFITRPSPLSNPHPIGYCQICRENHTREQAIKMFQAYFLDKLDFDLEFKLLVESVRGKSLGCCCVPLPCHGNVIAEYLNQTVIVDSVDSVDSVDLSHTF